MSILATATPGSGPVSGSANSSLDAGGISSCEMDPDEAGRSAARRDALLAAIIYGAGGGPEVDATLAAVAAALRRGGHRLAGAVQSTTERPDRCRCDMLLEDLGSGQVIAISEDRGVEARGCRLDAVALEQVVALSGAALDTGATLLIVNRFGRREAEGHGFRAVIARAVASGTPVLLAVGAEQVPAWREFTGGMDAELPLDGAAIEAWCAGAIGSAVIP